MRCPRNLDRGIRMVPGEWITKLPYETKCSNMETQNTHTHIQKLLKCPPPQRGPTSCPKLFSVTGAPL